MKRCALIGYPLGHSLSPELHRRLFELEKLDAVYSLDAFPPERFDAELPRILRYDAFNVTIPYKRGVIPYLDALTPDATLYGAVNCVRRDDTGRLIGDNTDCGGFLRAMSEQGIIIAPDTRVCILGAGGVGRMFAIECARRGSSVTVAVRDSSREKADVLHTEIHRLFSRDINVCAVSALNSNSEHPFDLVINATPAGMFPKICVSPVPPDFLRGVKTVFDCVYRPSETLLLRQAKESGCKTVGGMSMLVYQAALAHERWYGTRFDAGSLASIISEMEETARHE